jgi:tripartite-type tricarboxylate transporter receptor subunit TctC
MRARNPNWCGPAILALLLCVSPAGAVRAETSFAGKTVTLLVNFAAGSSTDVFTRMIQPFFASHLPGHPTVIVVNQPGAGGINAATHFYVTVPPDGLTIGMFATVPAQVLAAAGATPFRFDIAKFGWIGAVSTVSVLLTAPRSGIAGADDLAHRRDQLFFAAPTLRGPNTVMGRLIFGMLGLPYKLITGYRSQPESINAVEKGEATAAFLNVNVFVRRKDDFARSGVRAILQQGYQGADGKAVGAPGVDDIPEADSVLRRLVPRKIGTPEYAAYRALRVGSSLAFTMLLPPGAAPDLIATLRTVLRDTIEDDGFKQAVAKSHALPVQYLAGDDALKLLQSALEDVKKPKIRAVLAHLSEAKPASAKGRKK